MATFLSEHWFEVADLRPRLRGQARVCRQRFRGKAWYVVHDPLTNRSHRFSATAWWLASQLDGSCKVDLAWQRAILKLGDEAPSQDDVIKLLSQLHAADLLLSDASPDSAELLERRARQRRPKWIAGLLNPLSVRLPLWDPDRFLTLTVQWVAPLISRGGLLAWLVIVLPALFLAGLHSEELTGNLADRVLSPSSLVSLALVYAVVKMLHELGHGYAVKAGGGEVHEAGVMLLVLAPTPYVDASASSVFRSKWYRAFVGAAGMLTELLVAALSILVWTTVEPGVVRSIAYHVILVAGISTLLFNANPLLRYDGYYILADLVEIPNLGQRANAHFCALVRRHLLRDADAIPPLATPGEARWFLLYAPAAFVCRAAISLSIALFVANKFFFLGAMLAIWSLFGLIMVPAFKSLNFLLTSQTLVRKRARAIGTTVGVLTAVIAFTAVVPMPSSTTVQAVVWVPEGAEVRAAAAGVVRRAPGDGLTFLVNQPLLEVEDQVAIANLQQQRGKVAQMRTQTVLDLAEDRARAFQSGEALIRETALLDDLEQRVAELVTTATHDGTFIPAQIHSLPGRFVQRGELIGYLLHGAPRPTLRAVVRQEDIGRVLGKLESIDIKLSDRIAENFIGEVVRIIPQGSESIPSKALVVEGGGELVSDPRELATLQTLDKVFQLDIRLASAPPRVLIGTRAHVRFRYQPEPLMDQGVRRLRQLFLSRLHV
jgi:putative peptide zinc metalloprotease protein